MNTLKRINAPVNGHTYLLEPGDGTRYKFTLIPYGALPATVYGTSWSENPFFLAIDVAYDLVGCGTMTVEMSSAENLPLHLNYLHSPGHGFKHVDKYTLAICILMAHKLATNPSALDEACWYAKENVKRVLNEA